MEAKQYQEIGSVMDMSKWEQRGTDQWWTPAQGAMRVPGVIFADENLMRAIDDKVYEQIANVASLPGIQQASFAMPDAHWGYGFPIGGVAAFDPDVDGVISAGGVGFDISCGVRMLRTGLTIDDIDPYRKQVADALYRAVPAGVGSHGKVKLNMNELEAMLEGGADWAVAQGYGSPEDLEYVEEQGRMYGAEPDTVSLQAKKRQKDQVGTLGSGNHYLEVQKVCDVFDAETARGFGLMQGEIVISIHCGSRGLGHQIGSEFLKEMVQAAPAFGIALPERELACAPIRSDLGKRYLGAMRAGINSALANRQVITSLVRRALHPLFPDAELSILYDVSHNTCKEEVHRIDGTPKKVFVHRKGATRAFGPGHPDLPAAYADLGQPVIIGGTMGTHSYVLAGTGESESRAFSSACHGAGRSMGRNQATKRWSGRQVRDELAARGIIVRSPSDRGIAEEAPGAYKDVNVVAESAERAGLARRVVRVEPLICVKG